MTKKYEEIFELAKPYLKQGRMKDFIVHTEGVVEAMELIIAKEGGDPQILIPSAILHDVGFSKVPKELQTNADFSKKREAQRQHLIFAKEIIDEILTKAGYSRQRINQIIEIVEAHKFQEPEEFYKRLLIDADNLSDVFKEQFYADVKSYGRTSAQVYQFRTENKYYTKAAQNIAEKEMRLRLQEITANED